MTRCLYSALLYLLSPLIWLRLRRERLPGRSPRERLGRVKALAGERVLWVHAASVGEVITARPLIASLLRDYPEHRIVVTTMTATGAARVTALWGEAVTHLFLPIDFPGATRRFVRRVAPELAILIEAELWPNLLHACAQAGVAVAVVNARLGARRLARYQRFAGLSKEIFQTLAWVGARSGEDARRFRTLGVSARRINVTGALKYDLEVDEKSLAAGERLRREIGDRPVWVAGSTHEGEEAQLLDARALLERRCPGALLILVPRHPQRFDEVAALCRERGLVTVRRSAGVPVEHGTAVYLGDTMGELMALYAAGDIAFVGGTLAPIGGHNLLEPAALGRPVVSGPSLEGQGEIACVLENAGALFAIESAEALAWRLAALFEDAAARCEAGRRGAAVVRANRGALTWTRLYLGRLIRHGAPDDM